ncbi:KGK domain-containing protein [Myxosarcina sp. GI1]|uniref:KGK domain-containing protein n=1 Tax=Myxosarcina sp. GI1 TaxID=1541065 RepID=UPI00068AED5C|nr:KGK domain-containing protein [Myxosarcina sp. GI1]
MKRQYHSLDNNKDSVINLVSNSRNSYNFFNLDPMFKLEALQTEVICKLLCISSLKQLEEPYIAPRKKWIDEGLDCELLKLGSYSWQKGKLRIKVTIEFSPDESEIFVSDSPLDDIRQIAISNNK